MKKLYPILVIAVLFQGGCLTNQKSRTTKYTTHLADGTHSKLKRSRWVFDGADLRKVIEKLVNASGESAILREDVQGHVFADLENLTAIEVLQVILHSKDLNYIKRDGVIYISKANSKWGDIDFNTTHGGRERG